MPGSPKRYGNFIHGKWAKPETEEHFPSRNPARPDEVLAYFPNSSHADVQRAVDAAESAYEKWREVPPPKRGAILLKAAQLLKERKNELGRLLTREMGKVLPEALGDVQEAIDMAEYMAGEGRRLFGHTTTSELRNKFAMTIRTPVGVVGCITPWNFPFAIPAWKMMPALICGNSIVFKPSSDTPLCAAALVEILHEAGIPPGVVNLVTGKGEVVGDAIVTNKKIRAISFTGSKATGERITQKAGIKKVGLELGGKNPVIVLPDADLALAVDGILWGAFGTTGQRCTATSRVIVHQKIRKKLEQLLLARTKKLKLGDGLKPSTDVGPLINAAAVDKSERYCKIGKEEGARLLCGGKRVKGKGYFFQPTIFSAVEASMRIAQEEIFGPVLSIIEARNLEEAIEICNATEYGLSSSVYTNDIASAFKAIQKIEAGITYINSSTIGSEAHLPFGGVKGTGNGTREGGIAGIDEFSEWKTVYVDYSGKLQRAQMDV
ncbi:MAG TPA: aldehyde dehydrogenase family protein [Candidatus Bilamarchaeaceae archaeon]|nr:aldehyde dehydrogenase family protein [Candidatus Bilamarchaeaceae archaeon]